MSQWMKLVALCRQNVSVRKRVDELYQRLNFPYKFRSQYAEWIEAHDWSLTDSSGTNDDRKVAETLFKELMAKIENTEEMMKDSKDFDLEKSLDFQCAKDIFRKAFEGNYMTFVCVLHNCMNEERMLIESCDTDNCDLKRKIRLLPIAQEGEQIKQMIASLQQQIGLADSMVQEISTKQENFLLNYQSIMEKIGHIDEQLAKQQSATTQKEFKAQKATLTSERDRKIRENFTGRTVIADTLTKHAKSLEELLAAVWKEIEKWQDAEKRSITGLVTRVEGAIENLDKMCQEVGRLYLQLIRQFENVIEVFKKLRYDNDKKLEVLMDVLTDLQHRCLDRHLAYTFVIDLNIPDRVLKVSSGKSLPFNMSVRLLGGCSFGFDWTLPSVKLSIFQEKEIPDGCLPVDGTLALLNGSDRQFSKNRGTDALIAHFTSVVLNNVRRPDRVGKNEELVTEQKYAFIFYTSVTIFGREIKLRVTSLPVILTSQTSQALMAKGTLIWDAAFSEQDRKPYVYRDKVPWPEFATMLSALFLQNTGRGLTPEQLNYLARLVFKQKRDLDSYDDKTVSEKQIIRDKMSRSGDFSFWKWVWANMNLVKKHVQKEWIDGLIYGFISKDDAQRLMINMPCGTFLLRFSETNIENSQKSDISGCLTLAFVEINPETGLPKIYHVREYLSPKELAEKGLGPVLAAMEVADYANSNKKKRLLRFLYPDPSTLFEHRFGECMKFRGQGVNRDPNYEPGKYSIEIYLTNEQPSRNQHQQQGPATPASISDAISSSPCPQTPQSVMSPTSDSTSDAYAAAFIDCGLTSTEYQMAAVQPQVSSCMLDACSLVQPQQLPQDIDQQLLHLDLSSMLEAYDPSGSMLMDLSGGNGNYLSSSSGAFLMDQLLVTDDDGDLMIANSSATLS